MRHERVAQVEDDAHQLAAGVGGDGRDARVGAKRAGDSVRRDRPAEPSCQERQTRDRMPPDNKWGFHMPVPEVLLGGHHERIARHRREQSLTLTARRRPDLLAQARARGLLSPADETFLRSLGKL